MASSVGTTRVDPILDGRLSLAPPEDEVLGDLFLPFANEPSLLELTLLALLALALGSYFSTFVFSVTEEVLPVHAGVQSVARWFEVR